MENNIIKQQTLALEGLYNFFNKELFEESLPSIALTIQTQGRKNCYGWCSVGERWIATKTKDSSGNTVAKWYEINLSAEYMDRGIEDTSSTLIHEMVHLQNIINGINDCNPKTQNHNKFFKESAEKVGLIVEKVDRRGWARTSLSDRLKELIKDSNVENVFNVARITPESIEREKKPVNKYVCECGVIMKSTKELNIICGKCMSQFEIED